MATDEELDSAADDFLAAAGCNELTTAGIARRERTYQQHRAELVELEADPHVVQALDLLSLQTVEDIGRHAGGTDRQLTILWSFGNGLSLRDIAQEIGWSRSTVMRDLKSVLNLIRGRFDAYPYWGLAELLRLLDTLRTNWPRN